MSSNPRPRWLVIAHAFNMDGRAASQTITDKLPHLLNAGIEIVVLSGVSGRQDTDVEHYQLWPMGPAGLRFELRHVLHRRWGRGVKYRLCMTLVSGLLLPWMLLEKFLRPIESSWSWWLSAYLKGRSLARESKFDLIYSTGGAFAAHMAGCALKRETGTPWMAEVHDPMVTPGHKPTTAQQKMQLKIEGQICGEADVAIWFADQALTSARLRHPLLGMRGKVLLPGIDNPFKEVIPYRAGKKFVIGHFGSLSPTRHLGPIIEALELLCDENPHLIDVIELHIYGGPLDSVSLSRLRASPVRASVHHFGRVEASPGLGLSGRQQVLNKMRSVDVLLLLHGEDPICAEYIPSKLYEYLWMRRPIIGIVHENPQMAAILSGEGHTVIEWNAKEPETSRRTLSLAHAIEKYLEHWSMGLHDQGIKDSPYTTAVAVGKILEWVEQMPLSHVG